MLKSKKNFILNFILFFFLFSYPLSFLIMFYLPFLYNDKFYSYFTVAFALIIYIMFFYLFVTKRIIFDIKKNLVLSIFVLVVCLYYCTSLIYGKNDYYNRHFMMILTTSIPVIFCSFILSDKEIRDSFINGLLIPLVIFSLFLTLFVIINGKEISKIKDYKYLGLTYQTISYYLMYSASLFLAIFYFEKNRKYKRAFCFISFVIEAITALTIGGRGAFAYIILVLAFIVVNGGLKFLSSWISLIKKPIFWITTVFLISFVIIVLNTSNFEIGIDRIFEMFDKTNDQSINERIVSYANAREKFNEKIFFGHGIGSVFQVCGFYTHHIFLDTLVEVGIVGTSLLLIIILYSFINMYKIVKKDNKMMIFAFYYLMGFSMSLFSGYYLTTMLLVFGSSFFICSKVNEYSIDLVEGCVFYA